MGLSPLTLWGVAGKGGKRAARRAYTDVRSSGASAASCRQRREEAAADVEPGDFLGVWMDRYGGDAPAVSTLNLYWTARITGGSLEAADDVAELRWFAPDEIPWDDLAFRVNEKVLRAWLA